MHVKVTTVRGDKRTYRYLSLVESFREGSQVRQRVIARLGEADAMAASGELGRIVDALGSHLGERASGLCVQAAPAFGSIAAISALFSRLGLDRHFDAVGEARGSRGLGDTVFTMVANRLTDPGSKRAVITEWLDEVALPEGVSAPSLDQCYRALDAIAAAKEATETHLYAALTDLANLDLRLCCYDLTSTYFESAHGPSTKFASRAFGYSRDHRSDRPQVMIGLLVTGDGIPIAHHVFAGNTNDASSLPGVMADLQERFGVGRIALVADRGLISEANLEAVESAGFDHVLATRLHRDSDVEAVLEAAAKKQARWTRIDEKTTATEVVHAARRYVVVDSPARRARDDHRREELLSRTEDKLIALDARVREGRLVDTAKIAAAADRILRDSGVARCFVTSVSERSFSWTHDKAAIRYEETLLAGRYVITTSLTNKQASTAEVVHHYKSLANVERRFRIMKDFLALRPVFHWTEKRVRGHIALCVIAAVIEAVMGIDLAAAKVMDPEIGEQHMSPRRALRELARIRSVQLIADDGTTRSVITKPGPDQARILAAFGVNTSRWRSRLAG